MVRLTAKAACSTPDWTLRDFNVEWATIQRKILYAFLCKLIKKVFRFCFIFLVFLVKFGHQTLTSFKSSFKFHLFKLSYWLCVCAHVHVHESIIWLCFSSLLCNQLCTPIWRNTNEHVIIILLLLRAQLQILRLGGGGGGGGGAWYCLN